MEEAWNYIGVVRFKRGEHRSAADAWATVLSLAERGGIVLPDPVHTNLARAWRLAEEPDRARDVLRRYLDEEPEGAWADETRQLLEVLEAEESASRAASEG